MSAPDVEACLARLYTDATFREQFLNDADQAMSAMKLSDQERTALRAIDRAGLHMAAKSYARKQANRHARKKSLLQRLLNFVALKKSV